MDQLHDWLDKYEKLRPIYRRGIVSALITDDFTLSITCENITKYAQKKNKRNRGINDDINIETIKFTNLYLFDEEIKSLPDSVKILHLGDNFNGSLKNIGDNINKLSIGKNFTKEIDFFPGELKELSMYIPTIENYILEVLFVIYNFF